MLEINSEADKKRRVNSPSTPFMARQHFTSFLKEFCSQEYLVKQKNKSTKNFKKVKISTHKFEIMFYLHQDGRWKKVEKRFFTRNVLPTSFIEEIERNEQIGRFLNETGKNLQHMSILFKLYCITTTCPFGIRYSCRYQSGEGKTP